MKNRLIVFANQLRSSYWFIPSLMAIAALLLSLLSTVLDETVGRDLTWVVRLIYVDSPESARLLLSTVASSMITVAGTVFSLTMVVLSLTSQQYGPLVLYQYMRDRGNQIVLGIFTATFTYSLLILRTIRSTDTTAYVPHISVLIALVLAFISLGMLIYFIHHVAESIQSTTIINRISRNVLKGIETRFPARLGLEIETSEQATHDIQTTVDQFEAYSYPILAEQSGYLQMIDEDKLFKVACEHDITVQIANRPGHFFIKGFPVAKVLPLKLGDTQIIQEVVDAFIIGHRRTQNQDLEFLFTELVSIAVRALSPGINDPYTAITCLDRLSEALCTMLQHPTPSTYRYDGSNRLRVIVPEVGFESYFHIAFDQIRDYGHADLRLAMHLLRSVSVLSHCTDNPIYKHLFEQYVVASYEQSRKDFTTEVDRKQLDEVYATVIASGSRA